MSIADVCQLSDEVRSGELLVSVFLDRAVLDPDSKEGNRGFVLRATYPTMPLRSLLEHVVQKLSGTHPKGSAVVRGTYGSGKSHGLLALYHVVGADEDGRATLRQWGVQGGLPDRVRVAAVQLRAERPDTLWELLFERAGCADLNAQVRDYPTREQWATLGRERPTLLIVDELEDWFAAQDAQERARTKDALANVLEAAELPKVQLAVALAVYGTNDELMAIINRLQPPIWDVGTAEDRQKIVRHRLIDQMDEAKAAQVVRSYIEAYEKVRDEFPSLMHLADLRREMAESYPFHPRLLRQAYQVYAAMPRHESTRGVVAVCATLLRQGASQRDLILTGDLDIANEAIASDLRKLDPELVQNATEDLRERCGDVAGAAGIVATILLHSFSPYGTPGATEEDVVIGSLHPQDNVNDLRVACEEVRRRGWFVDEAGDRLRVTKEVVLVKQIEQMARGRLETPEGREEAAQHVHALIREVLGAERMTLYPDELPAAGTGGSGLKYVVSLVPIRDQDALDLLRGLDNTLVLLAPKPSVRDRVTADRDLQLRTQRVLVCEELLKQRGRRQNEVRTLKGRFESELRRQLDDSYARWMRISRTNELGQEPNFIVRPVDCALSVTTIEDKLREQYDVDAMRDGIARLLRAQRRELPKGSDSAGLTLGQIKQGLRRERGLPMLAAATAANFESALRRMVADAGDNGIVVQVGRVLYGFEEKDLPAAWSDDWRMWLKPYAPEPRAREDVKQKVRQELARAWESGIQVADLKTAVTRETGTATEEVGRAVVELVNDREAIAEQGADRYPDDGMLSVDTLHNDARVWLLELAPPDDRRARVRILELVELVGEDGISWSQAKAHLEAEGFSVAAIWRAVAWLMEDAQAQLQVTDAHGQTILREPGQIPEDAILRAHKETPAGAATTKWRSVTIAIQPYRLPVSADLVLTEFRTRLADGSRVREATFTARTADNDADPLFGPNEQASQLASVQAKHELVWQFQQAVSKDVLLRLIESLLGGLKERGPLTFEGVVQGETQA